ncbi:MAG: hypothetical protein II756_06715 [Clostridia bacterium]|nr:hypothetical protein [Clostridia bacterium]
MKPTIKPVSGYAPEYPKKPGGAGKRLAAVTAAALLAAGLTACTTDPKPELGGAPVADETPICTEPAPETDPTDEADAPSLLGDVVVDPPELGGAPIPDGVGADNEGDAEDVFETPCVTGLIAPDPGDAEGD